MISIRRLTLVLASTGAVVALLDAGLGSMLYISKLRTKEAMALSNDIRKALASTKADVLKAESAPRAGGRSSSVAVADLHERLEDAADAAGCDLMDFQASDETAPFLSRYSKLTSDTGWQQTPVRATLEGGTKEVFGTLERLKEAPVPIEIDTLDVTRTGVDTHGTATISAHVELRALTSEANP